MRFHRPLIVALAVSGVSIVAACAQQSVPHAAQTPSPRDGSDRDEARPGSITFKTATFVVGRKRRSSLKSSMVMAFELTIEGKTIAIRQSMIETELVDEEVLAASDDAITKAKFTYVDQTKTKTLDGKEPVRESSRVGKTFVLEFKDGKVLVTDEAGAPVSADDEKALIKSHRSFGRPDPFETALPEGPVRVGDKLDGLAHAFVDSMNRPDDGETHDGAKNRPPDVRDVEMRLVEIRDGAFGPEGVLAVRLTMTMAPNEKDPPISFAVPLAGTIVIRASGVPTSIRLKGPLQISPLDSTMQISGTGSWSMDGAMADP